MNIVEIYEKYKIPPNLQLHQLRVAGVAKLICDNFNEKIDEESIIKACLLHDMGNIIKFELGRFPEFLEPQGLEYWQNVKNEFIEKYGNDEHIATSEIAKEIEVSEDIYDIINTFGFSKYKQIFESTEMEGKIAAYSDHRVKPYGIGSLEERIVDLRKRYDVDTETKEEIVFFEECAKYAQKVEEQIFRLCKIKPGDISDKTVNILIEELKSTKI